MLSNGGDDDVALSFEVFGYDGVKIDDDDVLLVPHATATRRLIRRRPPTWWCRSRRVARSSAAVTLHASSGGAVAGAGRRCRLTSPDVASRARRCGSDRSVALAPRVPSLSVVLGRPSGSNSLTGRPVRADSCSTIVR